MPGDDALRGSLNGAVDQDTCVELVAHKTRPVARCGQQAVKTFHKHHINFGSNFNIVRNWIASRVIERRSEDAILCAQSRYERRKRGQIERPMHTAATVRLGRIIHCVQLRTSEMKSIHRNGYAMTADPLRY